MTRRERKQARLRCSLDGDLATLGALRSRLRVYLANRSVPAEVEADIVLATQEAAMNAVRAGAGTPVSVAVWADPEAIWVSVQDSGRGFAHHCLPRWPSPWSTHGRGLCLMHALMDGVEITHAHGTRVVMHRSLSDRAVL